MNSCKFLLAVLILGPTGGTLGFHCTHAYAHSYDRFARRLPFALKGVDVMVYTIFRSLGLDATVRPVLEHLRNGYRNKKSGDLIATGLHSVKLTEEGGYDGGPSETEVRMTDQLHFRSS